MRTRTFAFEIDWPLAVQRVSWIWFSVIADTKGRKRTQSIWLICFDLLIKAFRTNSDCLPPKKKLVKKKQKKSQGQD